MTTNLAKLFSKFYPAKSPSNENLIILHGLLGSSANFSAISKQKIFNGNLNVHLLDLRNHGHSSHLPTMTIPELANDVSNYINEKSLKSTYIMGHS